MSAIIIQVVARAGSTVPSSEERGQTSGTGGGLDQSRPRLASTWRAVCVKNINYCLTDVDMDKILSMSTSIDQMLAGCAKITPPSMWIWIKSV